MTAEKSSAPFRGHGFRRVAFPPERRLVVDTLRLGRRKPMMHGLLELDVTRARQLLREHKTRTGEPLSFTAFVLACIGRAVGAHVEVHALRDWFGRLILFKDVDATVMVEVTVEGRHFALAHVVRGIERRSVHDIHEEIRAVTRAGVRTLSPGLRKFAQLFLWVPGPVRRFFFRLMLGFPQQFKKKAGTLLVTSVGMFGGGVGWGFSAPGIHNLSVVIGGIATRAADAASQLDVREVLCLTVSANHEVVDGAPLARFAARLRH